MSAPGIGLVCFFLSFSFFLLVPNMKTEVPIRFDVPHSPSEIKFVLLANNSIPLKTQDLFYRHGN